jgi:peptidoglycan-associated lipoprotein
MRKPFFAVLVVLMSVTIAACGGKKGVKEEGASVEDRGVSAAGTGTGVDAYGRPIGTGEAGDLLGRRKVYFEFDSSALDEESQALVEAHANYLVNNPNVTLVLEGHADERGTREYNLALGDRRAQAVSDFMGALGVTVTRIQNVSYGEERPESVGHDESAWRMNRRVEILYGN